MKDKSLCFKNWYGEDATIPFIEECPVNISCQVIEKIDIYHMDVYIAKINTTYISDECFINGEVDSKTIDSLIYLMDNQYWKLGENIGIGFNSGKNNN